MEARKDNIQGRFVLQTASITPVRAKRRRKLVVRFDGVDMRSRQARRLKAILADLVAQFGDDDLNTLRTIAANQLALEQLQADALAGRMSAIEQSVRLANAIARARAALRSASRAKPTPGQALADYLRQTYGASAPGEAAGGHFAAADDREAGS